MDNSFCASSSDTVSVRVLPVDVDESLVDVVAVLPDVEDDPF